MALPATLAWSRSQEERDQPRRREENRRDATRATQRTTLPTEDSGKRPTSKFQRPRRRQRELSEFDVGRWKLGVGRFLKSGRYHQGDVLPDLPRGPSTARPKRRSAQDDRVETMMATPRSRMDLPLVDRPPYFLRCRRISRLRSVWADSTSTRSPSVSVVYAPKLLTVCCSMKSEVATVMSCSPA